jgi:DNA topoisomerase-1
MSEAVYGVTEARIAAKSAIFTGRGRVIKFDGFTKIASERPREEQVLPPLLVGEKLDLNSLEPIQHFTEPPSRYTEASLIKALEKFGIGRPSTYAPTLSTIQERGYVILQERRLVPTDLGILLTEKLEKHFKNFISYTFTAEMEDKLDRIEEGKEDWVAVVKEFYRDFSSELELAVKEMTQEQGIEVEKCPKCTGPMVTSWSRYGKMLVCSECKNKKILSATTQTDIKCDECKSPTMIKFGRFGKFISCTKYPDCKFTISMVGNNRILDVPKQYDLRCEKCGSPFAVRTSRRGPFIGCTKYPDCKNAKPIPRHWLVPLVKNSRDRLEETPEEREGGPE